MNQTNRIVFYVVFALLLLVPLPVMLKGGVPDTPLNEYYWMIWDATHCFGHVRRAAICNLSLWLLGHLILAFLLTALIVILRNTLTRRKRSRTTMPNKPQERTSL